ncbi:MAG: 30S ribosome-binding factor RbfA [Pirellulales bacterium]
MTSRRVQKAAEAIREVVSMAILAELKDPRIRDVTVTYVEVSADMRQAKVHVSVMGDDTKQNLSLRGLQNAAGFLQSKVADRINTRYTPKLLFELDMGVKRSIEIAQILQQVLPETPAVAEWEEGETEDGETEDGESDDVAEEAGEEDSPGEHEADVSENRGEGGNP